MTVPSIQTIRAALDLLVQPGQVTELRALNVPERNGGWPATVSGYFDDLDTLAGEAAKLSGRAAGVYITPNSLHPALLARSANRARRVTKSDPATADHDVVARRWLLIDGDPARPAGISSTDVEHDAAIQRVRELRNDLLREGWPEGVLADSGNGGHLLYRIDLPADDHGLVKRVLECIAKRFSDDRIKVDTTNHNPARIWKLYGTLARKGDNTLDRPHRFSAILEIPVSLTSVTREQLEALAEAPSIPISPPERSRDYRDAFDLEAWIARHAPDADGPEGWQNGGRRWVFQVCPWNSDHSNASAYITQHQSGAISAGCHHNGCKGRNWRELRGLREPQAVKSEETTDDDGRPFFDVRPDLNGMTDDALRALASANVGLFVRARTLVTVEGASVEKRPWLVRDCDTPSIIGVSEARLLSRIDTTSRWQKLDSRGKKVSRRPCMPPAWLPRQILARATLPLPALTGIIGAPTLRRDGSLLERPGYDAATGLLYVPTGDGGQWPGIPAQPTQRDAFDAVEILLRPLRDFPFLSGSDLAATIAVIFTLLVRDLIDGPVPLFAFRSPAPGTGKGLLAESVCVIGTGHGPGMMPLVEPDELRKRVTSLAQDGTAVVLLDNLSGAVGNDLLASLLTATTWEDRILGTNTKGTWPLRMVWLATGNNIVFKATLARRVTPIDLDAKVERPEDRTGWKFPNLIDHVRAHRLEYVAAALTILRGFHVAGRPGHGRAPMGSFERWDELIRSAVVWVGLKDFAAVEDANSGRNRIRRDSDQDSDALVMLLMDLRRVYRDQEFTAAEAAQAAETDPALRSALTAVCRRAGPTPDAVSYALRGLQNRRAEGLQLIPGNAAKRPRRYAVLAANGNDGDDRNDDSNPSRVSAAEEVEKEGGRAETIVLDRPIVPAGQNGARDLQPELLSVGNESGA